MKINIGKFSFKLKGGLGTKNIVVGLAWGIFITGIVAKVDTGFITIISIFSFVFVKNFITTVMYDFRDINGDRVAGLKTLPIYLGENKTRTLLVGVHLIEHSLIALTMITGILEFKIMILLYCFISGMIYIILFAKSIIFVDYSVKGALYCFFYKWELCVALVLQAAYLHFM